MESVLIKTSCMNGLHRCSERCLGQARGGVRAEGLMSGMNWGTVGENMNQTSSDRRNCVESSPNAGDVVLNHHTVGPLKERGSRLAKAPTSGGSCTAGWSLLR
jgi:hypothetical protein